MKLVLLNTPLGPWAAAFIAQIVSAKNGVASLGLPTGSTVEPVYACLRQKIKQNQLSFSAVTTFNMDEYVGLSKSDPHSYYAYMSCHLFDGIAHGTRHQLDGRAADPQQECARYENLILQHGPIDLFVGGVGQNGHIAFNEPYTPFDSCTHVVQLAESTRQANARFFDGDIARVPTHALTVGIGTILQAKQLLFLANGSSKAWAVAQLENKGTTPAVALTALKLHPNAVLAVDAAAASALKGPLADALETQKLQHPQAECWTAEVPL